MSKPGKDLLVWRIRALSSSPRRGTLLGPGSQSRPSELEDICSGQLSGKRRRSQKRFSAQMASSKEDETGKETTSPTKTCSARGFSRGISIPEQCVVRSMKKRNSQMVKFEHPYHLAFFTNGVFGQEAILL